MTDKIEPKQIVFVDGAELHVFGFVCVRWNTKLERTASVVNGVRTTIEHDVRTGQPYICFVEIQKEEHTNIEDYDYFLRDRCPVEGGLSLGSAELVYAELGQAIAYLKQITA